MKPLRHINARNLGVVLIFCAVVVAVVVALSFTRKPETQSNLPSRDLRDVCRVVDSDFKEFMPFLDEFSWDEITFLPSRVRARHATGVLSAYRCSDGTIDVEVGGQKELAAHGTYRLKKIGTGWHVVEGFIVGPTMEPSWEWPDVRKFFPSLKL